MGYGDDLLVTKIAASEKKKYPNRKNSINNSLSPGGSHICSKEKINKHRRTPTWVNFKK